MKCSSVLTMSILSGGIALAFDCGTPGIFTQYNENGEDPLNAHPDITFSFLCDDNIGSVTLSLYLATPQPGGTGGVSVREGTQVNLVTPTNVNFLSAFSTDYMWTNFGTSAATYRAGQVLVCGSWSVKSLGPATTGAAFPCTPVVDE